MRTLTAACSFLKAADANISAHRVPPFIKGEYPTYHSNCCKDKIEVKVFLPGQILNDTPAGTGNPVKKPHQHQSYIPRI